MKAVVDSLNGRAVLMPRDDIDTDAIYPARYLRSVQKVGLGKHLFEDWRQESRPEVAFMQSATPARVIVSMQNFGCGSSREHAVWSLSDYGVKAVIALSFGDIFRNNCVKNGVVAATLSAADHERLVEILHSATECELSLSVSQRTLTLPDGNVVPIQLAQGHAEQLLSAEDEIDRTLRYEDALRAYEQRIAQTQPWLASMG